MKKTGKVVNINELEVVDYKVVGKKERQTSMTYTIASWNNNTKKLFNMELLDEKDVKELEIIRGKVVLKLAEKLMKS